MTLPGHLPSCRLNTTIEMSAADNVFRSLNSRPGLAITLVVYVIMIPERLILLYRSFTLGHFNVAFIGIESVVHEQKNAVFN